MSGSQRCKLAQDHTAGQASHGITGKALRVNHIVIVINCIYHASCVPEAG